MAHRRADLLKQSEITAATIPDSYARSDLRHRQGRHPGADLAGLPARTCSAAAATRRANGYGSYGIRSDPGFSADRLSLLDRGYTLRHRPCPRRQELGRPGTSTASSCTRRTPSPISSPAPSTSSPRATRDRTGLAVKGGSAGGMLMGAVVNMRPDLFRALVAEVPFVDVLRSMLDPLALPLTTGEFTNGATRTTRATSSTSNPTRPTTTSRPKPTRTCITSGLNDDQVPYWQPAKWTASGCAPQNRPQPAAPPDQPRRRPRRRLRPLRFLAGGRPRLRGHAPDARSRGRGAPGHSGDSDAC